MHRQLGEEAGELVRCPGIYFRLLPSPLPLTFDLPLAILILLYVECLPSGQLIQVPYLQMLTANLLPKTLCHGLVITPVHTRS